MTVYWVHKDWLTGPFLLKSSFLFHPSGSHHFHPLWSSIYHQIIKKSSKSGQGRAFICTPPTTNIHPTIHRENPPFQPPTTLEKPPICRRPTKMQPRCNTLATPVLLPSNAAMRREITCAKTGSKSWILFFLQFFYVCIFVDSEADLA